MKPYQLVSIAILLSVLTAACNRVEESATASSSTPAIPVQLQTLGTGTLQDSTEFVGTLEAAQTVDLKPQIEGRIAQILTRPGDRVKQGDPIFILAPDQTVPQYQSAQADVNAFIAARHTAAQQLKVAQSQLKSAQSQSQLAQITNNRYQLLVRQGAIDRQTADQFATDSTVQANAVKTAQDQVNASKATLMQAEANVRKAQASASAAEVSVNFKRVVAPIDGLVGNITLKMGDYVESGQTLTTINQNNTFDLQIPIPLNHASTLKPGLPVRLLDPTKNNQISSGRIYFIASAADPGSQSILARAQFLNTSGQLRDAQYVKARVIWDTKLGILVPVDAVTTIGGQNFVFVAQPSTNRQQRQTVARQIPVTLGAIQGQSYQVIRGLKPGERLITTGILNLRDGVAIAPQSDDKGMQP